MKGLNEISNKMKEFEFKKKKLENGLTVLFEKRNLPVVSVSTACKFGSEFESLHLKGVAHFIEHLVFKGTKNKTVNEISEEVEKKGGIINAFTGEEFTCFWNKLPSKYLSTAINITSDLALNPLFDKEALERERAVILEEIKMYNDNPQFYVLNKIKELLYEKPFGLFGAGTAETMKAISRNDVLNVFKNSYSTNNMVLTVVGDADFDEICELARIFPKIEKKVEERKPIMKNSELIKKRKDVEQANLVLGYHAPNLIDKRRYAAEIMDAILGRGMSSRLFQEIREKRGLAYAVKGMLEQDKNYGYEMIYIGTVKKKVKEVKELILKEIKKIYKLEKRDLNEAKEQLIGLRQVERENSEQAMIGLILEENAGDVEEYYKYEDRINAIKLEEVRKLSKLKGYSFVALVPE